IEDQDFDALPSKEDIVSFLRELGHTGVINSVNDVVIDQMHQPPQMKESKAYKTYLGYATGTIPPKVARKFKKASPSKKDSIVIREPLVETQSKRKEKVDVARGKGIDLISEVALTEEAQMKDVRKKILRDFHKSHPSGSGLVAEKPPRFEKITPLITSEGTSDKPRVPGLTKDKSTESESESWGNDDDDSNDEEGSERENNSEEHESDSEQDTDGSESDSESDQQDDDDEVKDDDEDDDNDDDKFEDIPPADTEIVSPLDVHDHHEVPRIHTSTLLAIPVSVIPEASPAYTNIPQSLQTFTSKPLQSTPSPLPTTETTNIPSLILDFALVFRFNDRVIALEKDVAELKNDPLHTQVIALNDHLDTRMGATREEFMNFLSALLTDRITEQVRNQLPQILQEEVSNFAQPVIEKMIQELLNQVNLAPSLNKNPLESLFMRRNQSFKVGDTDTPQEPTNPDWNEDKNPKKGPTQIWLKTLAASTSTGKLLKEFDELISTPTDFSSYILNGLKIKNLTQEILLRPSFRLLKGTRSNYAELEYNFEECYKALLEKLDWENSEGGDYPFDLSKPPPLIMLGNRQSVPVKFFINNDLKYLQGGISTMTYTTSTTKTKAAQCDLPGIKDMVPNIWSLVKVSYDKYALWGISHWIDQRKTFYVYTRGIQSRGDVYSTKRILAVTHVLVMRKHGYGYLEEIVVRRADNMLYKFKEDITKNIDMEYLPKRRWITLEKKRAHYMIKDINKLLKERRMMRSLEKFVGGRLYETDLRLLQRTI
nr:hypothetical protein [Tanacetum cinerariifolium]